MALVVSTTAAPPSSHTVIATLQLPTAIVPWMTPLTFHSFLVPFEKHPTVDLGVYLGLETVSWRSIGPSNAPVQFFLPDPFPKATGVAGKNIANFQYNSQNQQISWTIFPAVIPAFTLPAGVTTTGFVSVTAPVTTDPGKPSSSLPDASVPTGGELPAKSTSNTAPSAGQTRPPLNNTSNNQGITSGVAAGIAIGCLLAGALIAGALLWFFCIRSRKRRGTRDAEASSVALIRSEKGPVTKATSLESGSPLSRSLDNGLPQPLEDGAISGEVSKISNLIKNHVQSFYHHNRAGLGLLDLDDLQALGNGLPISPGTLSTLLGNTDTREIALRFSIAWAIISRIQPSGDSSTTFLPPEVATCFQSIPVAQHKSRAQSAYLNKWRSITAELMQSSYGRSTFPVTDPRTRNIEKAADILDGILRPYMDSRVNNNERRRNLEEILKRAAIFAFTLFSQPSSWDFDWRGEEGVQSNSLCIFPALVQVTDELGDPVKPPRALSEAIVRKLDG